MTILPYHFEKEGALIKSELMVLIDAETAYNVYSSASEGTMMEATALFNTHTHCSYVPYMLTFNLICIIGVNVYSNKGIHVFGGN